MDFISAVKTVKEKARVTKAFYGMLCDHGAFDEEERWAKGIVKQICESGFACRLSTLSASNGQWETEVSDMMYKLTSQFGYREDAVSDIFHKLCLGLGLVGAKYDWVRAFHVGSPQAVSRSSVSGFSPQAAESKASGSANGHDYVDLGLPSGTLWATCNLGASKPEDFGNYYAWGETDTKTNYNNPKDYKYFNVNYNNYVTLTKYCNRSDCGYNDFVDNLTDLQSVDDAATANWGSGWRTPTKAQYDELLANTSEKWMTCNGVKGSLFTAKNGQSIFLPASGVWGSELDHIGIYAYYWSRSLFVDRPYDAWYLIIPNGSMFYGSTRNCGFSVRPIYEKYK
jgi:hypothetical protein